MNREDDLLMRAWEGLNLAGGAVADVMKARKDERSPSLQRKLIREAVREANLSTGRLLVVDEFLNPKSENR